AGPRYGRTTYGPSATPQTNSVWPKSPLSCGMPPRLAISKSPPRPKIEFETKRMPVWAAASRRPCSTLFTKMRGSLRFEFKSCKRSCTGPGIAAFTNSEPGRNSSWFAAITRRFTPSFGSLTGSDVSLGTPAHAPRSRGNTHAIAHLTRPRARRIPFFFPTRLRYKARRRSQKQPTRARPLAYRVNQIMPQLAVGSGDDCYFFASPLVFAAYGLQRLRRLHGSGRFCRWVASRAGWKNTAAARVVSSDRAMSLPMLDVPG